MEFEVSPLKFQQKAEVMGALYSKSGVTIENAALSTFKILKYSLKGIKGLKTIDGSDYALEFDDEGNLQDSCADDLLNIEQSNLLQVALNNFLNGVPEKLIDPQTGEELKEVELIRKDFKKK
jgi:hypothetical protein